MSNSCRSFAWILFAGLATVAAAPAPAATIPVTGVSDVEAVDGVCSLREAILAANGDAARNECPAGSGADRITFSLATPATIALSADLPGVQTPLRIQGPGSGQLTIDGQDLWAIVEFDSIAQETWGGLDGMTLTRGLAERGGAVYAVEDWAVVLSDLVVTENVATNGGGGIHLTRVASARVEGCWVSDNRADGPSGGGGIAILEATDVSILRSTVSGNEAQHVNGAGGGVQINRSEVRIERSTVSGNVALSGGGGIRLSAGSGFDAELVLKSSTVFENRADDDATDGGQIGGGIVLEQAGGRIATLDIGNTIVAGNVELGVVTAPDISAPAGVLVELHGSSLVGINSGASTFFATGSPNALNQYVGSSAAPIDPRLGVLDFFGGATPSHRPLLAPDSIAIDHGRCTLETADQRGFGTAATGLRAFDLASVPDGVGTDGCDIGSHERGADSDVDPYLFADGFENENTLLWSSEVP